MLSAHTLGEMHAAICLAIVILLMGVLLLALTVWMMALLILRPPRMSDGKAMYLLHRLSPGDLGMRFENEVFRVRDVKSGQVLQMAGWWIPHREGAGQCVILIHGYADAKVGAIAWAPLFHSMGFHILAIDLRAHGESGGKNSTGGFFEREDVTQIIDQLIATRPEETRKIVLFGVSAGAAVVAAVGAGRQDLSGIILESPFADYRAAVKAHVAALGLPGGWILRAALKAAEIISGARFDRVRPVETIEKIECPTLVIFGGADPFVPVADAEAIRQAMGQGSVYRVPGAGHLSGILVDPDGYREQIASFLRRI